MIENNGKDDENANALVLRAETAIERRRAKSTLMTLENGRVVSSDGRFHADLAASYIMDRGRRKWIRVSELARVFSGSSTIDGKNRVRKNACVVFREMLVNNEFLLYEVARNGRIEALKVLDATSHMEKDLAEAQLKRMRRAKELSAEKYEHAQRVIGVQEALVTDSEPT